MAKRKVARRRRVLVAIAMVGFVIIASAVIVRRSYGITGGRELRDLDRRRMQLVSQKAQLESDIRLLSSRAKLQPVAAARLGLRIPDDSQVVFLPRGARGTH